MKLRKCKLIHGFIKDVDIITCKNLTYTILFHVRDAHHAVVPVELQQSEPGPLQSRSFKVLQKITDTDADNFDGDQLRKMQLTEDDKFLMNKFKEQGIKEIIIK